MSRRVKGLTVGIPTVNRYDKLEVCLRRLVESTVWPERLVLVDNGGKMRQDIQYGMPFPTYVVKPGRNLGVAASWNLMWRFAADDQFVVLSDDLWLNPEGLEKLWSSKALFTLGDIGWTCFKTTPECRRKVGWFDEGFWPCNFEDVDMQKRLDQAGVAVENVGNVGRHDEPYASQRPWGMMATESMNRVRRRFNAKWRTDVAWGGVPPKELDWCFEDFRANAQATRLGTASHFDMLKMLASRCERVVEFGTGVGHSGVAILAGRPKEFVTYDLVESPLAGILENVADGTAVSRRIADVRKISPEHGDMLFIDSRHTGEQLAEELNRHADGFGRYLVIHDTVAYGVTGEEGSSGLNAAWKAFVECHRAWLVAEEHAEWPGMVILRRAGA